MSDGRRTDGLLFKKDRVTHELKCDPELFDAMLRGIKKFDIRRDDREPKFVPGHYLKQMETVHSGVSMKEGGAPLEYTGRTMTFRVLFTLRGDRYGLQDGYVAMGLEEDYGD